MPAHSRAKLTKAFPGLGKPKSKAPKKEQKWEKVGKVGVDSGTIYIGDPCYVLHRDKVAKLPKDLGKNWMEFCDRLGNDQTTQFKYDLGHTGLGVALQSGYGDGCYDVEVQRTDEGRVKAVRVVFIK